MAVTTVFATAPGGDGTASSGSTVYATARTSGTLTTAGNHQAGQNFSTPNYLCREAFLIFDTSAIADDQAVSDVVLSLDGNTDNSATDFDVIAAASSYNGGVVATTDWVDGSTLSGLTQLATWNTAGYSANYNAFTSAGAVFNSAINLVGNTALILFSSRHANGDTPTGAELVTLNDADAAGTTTDPKLDITHDTAVAATGQTWVSGKGKWWP